MPASSLMESTPMAVAGSRNTPLGLLVGLSGSAYGSMKKAFSAARRRSCLSCALRLGSAAGTVRRLRDASMAFALCFTIASHMLLPGLMMTQPAAAQEIERIEAALIDQEPFDLITLTKEEGGASVKVLPIPFPGRKLPSNPKPTDRLDVVLVKFQERRYEIAWQAIASIGLYEVMIYEEAIEKLKQKDFATAFQNLSFLMKNYPGMPRLEELRQQFIFQSAIDRYGRGELRQTLSALEELRATAAGYKTQDVNNALSKVAGSLIEAYIREGKLGSAQVLLNRLESQYGRTLSVVTDWLNRLEAMALRKKSEATALLQDGRFREARQAAVAMSNLFPDLDDGQTLIEEINRQHPMVRVGVMQRSSEMDPTSLVDWPARRTGTLTREPLFKFLETGAEGGRYGFALGTFRLSDDRQQLILSLDNNIQTSMDAGLLAQELLLRATPAHASFVNPGDSDAPDRNTPDSNAPDSEDMASDYLYNPSWAAIFESVSTGAANQVIVQLRRPHVLPHALLQWVLPDDPQKPGAVPGDYQIDFQDESESSFKVRDEAQPSGQPVEIIELFYEDPKEAINDLLLGEIDVLDQLYPADAKRLASQPGIRIGSYALPTTHMLIPVSNHAYLADRKFRRALMYATNREEILRGELLGSTNDDDGRLVSGPFPIGEGQADTLSYAYNPDIQPMDYSPQLARLLLVMTSQEMQEKFKGTEQSAPELQPLVIGCPDYELARVAVQAMIQQWSLVGIKAEMVILPASQMAEVGGCDLVYALTTMWEPATDIERLMGSQGIAATDDPFIIQAMERLRDARNWREVRNALQELHRLIAYHLPILPLWQITDRFAVSSYLDGLEDNPISLYQNVASWRTNLGFKANSRQP